MLKKEKEEEAWLAAHSLDLLLAYVPAMHLWRALEQEEPT
jgi:hypothetical protein